MTQAVAPIELPEHVADAGEWREWPLKLEAHLKWGVRQRQVESFARNGRLKVYVCPDGSKRIEPDALCELFGEPGVLQGRERDVTATERRQRQTEAALPADPVALMFAKSVAMMEGIHAQSLALLKVLPEPMQQLIAAYQSLNAALVARVAHLEKQSDEAAVLRSELADARQEREVALKQHESREKRRDETLALLKDQLPALVGLYVSGNSLSDFAKRAPKDVIEAIVDAGVVGAADLETLRRAAGIVPKPAPTENTTVNGVS